MKPEISIKEDSIDNAVKVTKTIIEFDKPYDKKYFEDRYQNSNKLILVAYINDFPVGYTVSYDRDEDGSFYCWMAGVDPEFRRFGILNKLMEYLYQWAKNHGYKKIKIKTRNNRREMLSFLVKSGFNFIEVEPWESVSDNRINLEKIL